MKDHGYVAESTEFRLEALEHNLWRKVSASYAAGSEQARSGELVSATPTFLASAGSFLLYILLWPTGWGARPEQALFCLALLTLVFWIVYLAHSRRLRATWSRLPQRQCWRISFPRERFDDLRGLVEAGVPFAGPSASPQLQSSLLDEFTVDVALESNDDFNPNKRAAGEHVPPAYSLVPGFNQYNDTFPPRRFNLLVYSIDAMLPVINLHHFEKYYPYHPGKDGKWQYVRWLSVFQHALGWILSTVFLASLII